MKKLILILSFLGVISFTSYGQELRKSNYPHWTISKDVHRMQYRTVQFVPATITTTNRSPAVTKGVTQYQASRGPELTGKVAMTGTPSWVISKGVARKQAERKQ